MNITRKMKRTKWNVFAWPWNGHPWLFAWKYARRWLMHAYDTAVQSQDQLGEDEAGDEKKNGYMKNNKRKSRKQQ